MWLAYFARYVLLTPGKAYEDMARIVHQHYPSINIEGSTYPPPRWRSIVASIVQICKFLLLALTITGVNPFPSLGLETPGFFTYATENKVSFYCKFSCYFFALTVTLICSTGPLTQHIIFLGCSPRVIFPQLVDLKIGVYICLSMNVIHPYLLISRQIYHATYATT
ncbi:unnamed protein product [Schistocephalus solidus]|uniref:Uncharacterized protein n=1 Tax=Schistocephalus solidus TaxID=70667 RepID=A0A3P7C8T2_SCHSO|nr:unnamed protein product [Schistocephalus solidus]